MKTRTHFLLIYLVIIAATATTSMDACAQDSTAVKNKTKKYYHTVRLSFENGMMVAGSDAAAKEVAQDSYYNGLDLRYGWTKRNPLAIYNRAYCFPTIGIGYYSSTYHNAAIGSPNALYFFFEIPFAFEGLKKWTASYIGAFGLSYNFNSFDSISNPENIFIGSRKNCYLNLALLVNYHINNNFTTFASLGYKHFSNGSFKKPNLGINLIPLTVGIKYNMSGLRLEKPETPLPAYINHNEYNLMFAFAKKEYDIDAPMYNKYTLGFNYLRQISYKHRVGAGVDVFYSGGSASRNTSNQSDFSKTVSYALVASGEWVINRVVSIPMGVGIYMHRNIENDEREPYYERVGLRFRFSEHYNLGLTIKAHGGVADIFEWTLAYTFHKDPNRFM